MKKLTRKTTALIAAGALSIPLLGAVPALAQSGSESASHTTTDATGQANSGHTGERRQKLQAEVAAELGISSDQLSAARATVLSRHIDERVAKGKITTDEGKQLQDAIGNGTLRDVVRQIRQAHGR